MNTNIDKENLYDVIKNIPNQLVAGLDLARDVKIDGDFKSIVVSGMGGSALPANLLRIYLHDLFARDPEANHRFGIFQNRFYALPPEAYGHCLNIISSYSGNTEETVSSFSEALGNNLPSVAIASGGKVVEMCEAHDVPYVKMPPPEVVLQPRMANGYNFAILFQILVNSGMVKDQRAEFESAAAKLKETADKFEELGKKLAGELAGKTPVIYGSTRFKSLAMIWKIMFNENAKTPAFWNFFPELNHNEMVGFTKLQGGFHIAVLKDGNDHPRNLKRIEATLSILEGYGVSSSVVEIPEGNILFRIFATLQIGCWASYYLALKYGIDPTPVDMVEKLKVELTK
ncbi:MAG: bifunctional phosphoglucose/phosphomannose isomerase [Candidatus Moranbacteria bacterium]|nr:bifunctional phosphoglucose/phosphomannose isomerase [Candidatus Moranbacteria bacterium]